MKDICKHCQYFSMYKDEGICRKTGVNIYYTAIACPDFVKNESGYLFVREKAVPATIDYAESLDD
jgi:hypothetical protein